MNEKVKTILDEEKRRFCMEHDLYEEEFVPLHITGMAILPDINKGVSFSVEQNGELVSGDILRLKYDGEMVDAKIISIKSVAEVSFNADIYKYQQYSDKMKIYRHYAEVPIEISDEEYEKLQRVYNTEGKPVKQEQSTIIPTIFYVIGIITFIGGVIGGFAGGFASAYGYSDFNAGMAFIIWGSAFVSGMFCIGFGKIIELLETIRNKL